MYIILEDDRLEKDKQRLRYFSNIINIARRHCRIGKVTPKAQKDVNFDRLNGGWASVISRAYAAGKL